MKRIKTLINTNFIIKMALIALCLLLVPGILTLILTYFINYQSLNRQVLIFNQHLADVASTQWEESLEKITRVPLEIYSAPPRTLSVLRQKNAYEPEERALISELLSGLLYANQNIIGIDITGTNGERIREYTFVSKSRWQSYAQQINLKEGFCAFPEEEPHFGAYSISLIDYPSYEILAFVTVYYSFEEWDLIAQNLGGGQTGHAVRLLDENGGCFYSSGKEGRIDAELKNSNFGLYKGRMNGEAGYYYVKRINIRNENFRLITFFPFSIFTDVIANVLRPVLLIDFLLLICMLLYLGMVYLSVLKPIRRIAGNMKNIQEGVYDYKALSKSQDEIGRMDRQYEKMVKHIDYLINQKMRQELEIMNSKLKTLQAQINPHFLNNILQMIATQALCEGSVQTNQMLCSLARLLQYNMQIDQDEVSLKDEIMHIKHYLKLQNERYGGRIHSELLVEDAACNMIRMPKMILQPLVENAIKYSYLKEGKECCIRIAAQMQKDVLHLSISDDGKGMTNEKKEELQSLYLRDTIQVIEGHGIGLLNVLFRLKIFYGDCFSWEIDNREQGCTILLYLPITDIDDLTLEN